MKPASVLILSVVFAPRLLLAQYTPPPDQSFGVFCINQLAPDGSAKPCPVPPPACPVGLQAWHLSDGDVVKTGIAHPKGAGQALQLTLSSPKGRAIVSAALNVRGWTPKGRLSQAAPDSSGNAIRRLRIRFSPSPDKSSVSDYWVAGFWVPGLAAVTSVELASLTYADGSIWTPSGSTTCSVAPDLFMPVNH